jgi:hypothetical protein
MTRLRNRQEVHEKLDVHDRGLKIPCHIHHFWDSEARGERRIDPIIQPIINAIVNYPIPASLASTANQ